MKKLLSSSLILLLAIATSSAVTNSWVYFGSDGKLAYQTWGNGNRIMDFSSAGYLGGGAALPEVATVQTLNPSGSDDTSALQNAVNLVGSLPLVNGFRGALQLGPDTFYVSSQINLRASGVVVRGSGSGAGGTTIVMTNALPFTLFNLAGSGSPAKSGTVSLTDSYVPSGATTFNVSSVSGFNVGDTVMINRTVTTNWIHYLGMDTLVRSGLGQTWISAGSVISTDRKIQQIAGNQITLDVPLTDSFDTNYLGSPAGTMAKYSWSGRISQVGLEHLNIQAPAANAAYTSVNMANIIDSWARDITIQDGVNCFTVQNSAKRVTVDSVDITHTIAITGDPPADFTITGTQILVNKCQALGTGVWPFVTQAEGTGPIVALNFYTTENGGISPHQRWTTGVLADNGSLPDAPSKTQGIAYRNRGTDGSGQGWSVGWSVAWNVLTPYFLVSAAPGTENWCIGGIGAETSTSDPNGIYDQLGSIVSPHSLYLEQLKERLGGAAVENIGYPLFTITNSPSAQAVAAGTNVTFTVTVGDPTQMSNVVALSVSGLPADFSAGFDTNSVTGMGNAILTVTASNSISPGDYTLNVIGTSAGLMHTSQVSLVVGRAAGANLKWTSTISGAWDIGNSINWVNSDTGAGDYFFEGDNVLFDDTPGVMTNIIIPAGVTVLPGAMTNNSIANHFTISGAGGIGGSGGIVKLGVGTLTLDTSNSFTGGVLIGGGTIVAGNATALGDASGLAIAINGGTLDMNGFALTNESVIVSGSGAATGGAIVNNGAAQTTALRMVTLAGDTTLGGTSRWDLRNSGGPAILSTSPAGSPVNLTKVGTNQISLVGVTGIDSALGNIDIQQGTLAIQTSTVQLGDPNKTITIHGGATLELWTLTGSPLNKQISVADGGTIFDEKGPSIIAGPMTLNGNDTFNVSNYGTPPSLTLNNAVAGPGGLSVIGGGNLVLAGTNTYAGGTVISSGNLILTNNGSIDGSMMISVNAGATLDASGRTDGTLTLNDGQTLTGNGAVNGDVVAGNGAMLKPGGSLTTLTFNNNLTLGGGSVTLMELDKTLLTNDSAQVAGKLTYGGTLVITGVGTNLFSAGDSFKLFNAADYSGAFTNIVPAIPAVNLAWSLNGGVLSIVAAPTAPPEFAGTVAGANNLIFSGGNGVPGWPYYVLASTNIALPVSQWLPVLTNVFDAGGNFIFTNPLDADGPQQFYLLKIP